MKTSFIHERVYVGSGLTLVVDGNSKITAGNGSYEKPVPNALSLPAASVSEREHCPGSTEACRASCYVRGLAKHAPDVYRAYTENATSIRAILSAPEGVQRLAADMLGTWITNHAPHGFRWHVSGDVRDWDHAAWITRVCLASPDVRHWIYTRSLEAAPCFVLARNLALNISADRENYYKARDTAIRLGARLCYMATAPDDLPLDLPDGSVVFPDYPLRGRELAEPTTAPWWQNLDHKTRLKVCPADFFGQSEAHRCGPCDRCLRPTGHV